MHPHSSSAEQTESLDALFPEPVHLEWDLDELAVNGPIEDTKPLPEWITSSCTQAAANRLLGDIDTILSQSGGSRLAAYKDMLKRHLTLSPAVAGQIANMLCKRPHVVTEQLRQWIERHGHEDLPEISLHFVKPHMLRVREHAIMQANLDLILQEHFSRTNIPVSERTLMDIGAWDGDMSIRMNHHFQNVIAIEPDETRFKKLNERALHGNDWKIYQATFEQLMDEPAYKRLHADCIYMGHIHYFLHDDRDEESFLWAHDRCYEGGIAITVLNDDNEDDPFTKAGLRRFMKAGNNRSRPSRYIEFLRGKGIAVRSMKPEIHVKAHTPDGRKALREFLMLQLEKERHDTARLDQYMQLLEQNGGVYRHIQTVFVLYDDPETAPAEQPEVITGMARPLTLLRLTQRQIQTVVPQVLGGIDPTTLQPVDITTATVGEIVAAMESLRQVSQNGSADIPLGQGLTALGWQHHHWYLFNELREVMERAPQEQVYSAWIDDGQKAEPVSLSPDTSLSSEAIALPTSAKSALEVPQNTAASQNQWAAVRIQYSHIITSYDLILQQMKEALRTLPPSNPL